MKDHRNSIHVKFNKRCPSLHNGKKNAVKYLLPSSSSSIGYLPEKDELAKTNDKEKQI
jgi:hypothetical protein